MDWKQQFKFHDLRFRNIGIVFLLLAVNLLILIQTSFWQVNPVYDRQPSPKVSSIMPALRPNLFSPMG